MKVIMKIILEKEEFEDLRSKYNDLEMLQCKQLYDHHKRNGIYNEREWKKAYWKNRHRPLP